VRLRRAGDVASLNRDTWSLPRTLSEFNALQGFTDAGERAALLAAAPRVRGVPALDVGVGAGRTVPLLRLLTDDYLGIDYAPAMVELCRRNHPGAEIRQGDARGLELEEGRFGFVQFSFNGIDGLDHDDRPSVLRELFRVLRPGGWLLFSTHNLDGPDLRDRPWRGYRGHGPRWYRTLRWTGRLPLNLPRYRRRWVNWWRNRELNRKGDGWEMRVAAPHDFGLVIHYVRFDLLLAEVANAGFGTVEVYDSTRGTRVSRGDDTRHVHAFHVLAQKPRGGP
jgi:SAM-dependent methyltransferase